MYHFLSKLAAVIVLGTGLTAFAADEKKTTPAKAPDWSHFASVTTVAGEVVEAKDDGITLKVNQTTLSRSGYGRRARVNPRTRSQELQFTFADAGLVRWKSPPPKLDDNGKKLPRSSKELSELKLPRGTPGFAAERGELQPGQIVELTLVRPKSISASKATFQDLKVKYAMILADPNSAAAPGGKKIDPKKK